MDTKGARALLVIDVQIGLIEGLPAYRGTEVVATIERLILKARGCLMPVIFVQHDGEPGHALEPQTAGWPIHPSISPGPEDLVIHKRASDAFYDTSLDSELRARGIEHLIVAGCMTEYCVDTTCRRAVTLGFDVTLVADAHTTTETKVLSASQIIEHHNWLLHGFDAGAHAIAVTPSDKLLFC